MLVWIVVCLAAPAVRACLRERVDEKAIQWSNRIVEARLVGVSERVEMKAVTLKPPAGTKSPEISAVYWYRVYSFEVQRVIDAGGASLKPRHRIEVVRFFGKADRPSAVGPTSKPSAADHCATRLVRDSVGQTFVLLLRPEQDIKIQKPPVWSDAKNLDPRDGEVHGLRAYAVIHSVPREEATDAWMANLRKVLSETRAAERKVSDNQIKKHVQTIVAAMSDQEAQEAIDALQRVGYKAVGHIKSARDKKETPPDAKDRLARLAIEISPPPLPIDMAPAAE
jgi:hypothetical protein